MRRTEDFRRFQTEKKKDKFFKIFKKANKKLLRFKSTDEELHKEACKAAATPHRNKCQCCCNPRHSSWYTKEEKLTMQERRANITDQEDEPVPPFTFSLVLYREGDQWFFDDNAKRIYHEEFVSTIPEMLYRLAGDRNIRKLRVIVSNQEFSGSHALEFEHFESGGVVYRLVEEDISGWLCAVFWEYFNSDNFPRNLWVSVEVLPEHTTSQRRRLAILR